MAATPAGPCATYPGDDTWTDAPFADGVVLIGDAAGYNDPIIGQGLSIAMRDARIVRDLILDGARDRPPSRRTARSVPHAWSVCDSSPTSSRLPKLKTPTTAPPGARSSPRS